MLIDTSRPNGQSSGEGVGPRPTRPEFDTREGHDSKRGLAAPPDPEWLNNGPLGYDEQSPGHPRTPRDDRENSWVLHIGCFCEEANGHAINVRQ